MIGHAGSIHAVDYDPRFEDSAESDMTRPSRIRLGTHRDDSET